MAVDFNASPVGSDAERSARLEQFRAQQRERNAAVEKAAKARAMAKDEPQVSQAEPLTTAPAQEPARKVEPDVRERSRAERRIVLSTKPVDTEVERDEILEMLAESEPDVTKELAYRSAQSVTKQADRQR